MSDILVEETPENAPGDLNALEKSLTEAVAQPTEVSAEAEVVEIEAKTDDKPEYIEDKFWTGDVEESLQKQFKSLKNLESAYGRMANDLGTQRKITDQILALDKRSSDLGTDDTSEKYEIDATKFIENPNEELGKYLSANKAEEDKAKQADQVVEMERLFLEKHPNFQETATSEEFTTWVNTSPTRSKVASEAASGDWTAADALMSEYQDTTAKVEPKEEVKDDLEGAKAASTESTASAGSTGSKKIWRRADLIELRMRKPEVYNSEAFQAEIMAAYAERRVK